MPGSIVMVMLALVSLLVPWRRIPVPEPLWLIAAGAIAGRLVAAPRPAVTITSDLGLLALLFTVGVELATAGHRPLSPGGTRTALVGAVVLGLAGGLAAEALTHRLAVAVAVTIAAIPTSAGIASRIASPVGVPRPVSYPEIVSAAVADDFLGLALLVGAPVLVPGVSGAHALLALGASVVLAAAFLALKIRPLRLRAVRGVLLAAGGFLAGVSPALIGIFLGHDLPEAERTRLVGGTARVLAPLFFVASGERLDPSLLLHPAVADLIGLLVGALVISRLAMVLVVRGSRLARWHVASAMLPRGEVTIAIGLTLASSHVLPSSDYAALIGLVVISTLASGLLAPRVHPGSGDSPKDTA